MTIPIHKIKQYIRSGAQLLCTTLIIWFIYERINTITEIEYQYLKDSLLKKSLFIYSNISIIIILTAANWYFETLKWKLLTQPLKRISTSTAFFQTLYGHTYGFITPAKIGDFGAKAYLFPKHLRKIVLKINFMGAMAQLSITLFFGLFAIGTLLMLSNNSFATLYWIILLCAIAFLQFVIQRESVRYSSLKKVILFSALRYIIFSHQLLLALWIFGVSENYIVTMSLISLIYLISSLVPVLSIFDGALRAGAGIFIFLYFGLPQLPIAIATLSVWLLNVALPAGIGGIYFAFFNPKESYKIK